MKYAIVTGGTGVFGVALIRYLLQNKVNVTALIRPGTLRRRFLPEQENLLVLECNLDNLKTVSNVLPAYQYDVFFHLGWEAGSTQQAKEHWNNMHLQNQNIGYALDAVELCHKIACPMFLATGSQAEYGYYETPVTETSLLNPQNGYAFAKICACQMTKSMCKTYGIKHIWARFFSVYGPYDDGSTLLGSSLFKLLRGERPAYTEGIQTWNYLYSYDAAKALYLLMEHGKDGEIYCVANESSKQLREYIQQLHRLVNAEIRPEFGEIPYRKDHVMYMAADTKKLQNDTGFQTEYSFEQGVTAMLEWALEEKKC